MSRYQVIAYIHPKKGGDDYELESHIIAPDYATEKEVREIIEDDLQKISFAPKDYTLKKMK